MSKHKQLGRIETKPVREYWENEASDFTPWLADNINLLGEEIGMELEVEEQESRVGSFRVDLVCKDENDRTVIIENQLEQTDHSHLGQILTYAAGKGAMAVVWVSTDFIDEHRAALDWLNEKTDESIQFFGVQIEVWQIGDSKAAPKFEVVCKPNEWTKIGLHSGKMSDKQKLLIGYWGGLRARMRKNRGKVKPQRPVQQVVRRFPIGVKEFRLHAVVRYPEDFLVVGIWHAGSLETKTAHYDLLREQKESIEKKIGADLAFEWRKPDGAQTWEPLVRLRREKCNAHDETNWDELHKWHHEHLEKFYAAFHERVQNLNLDDWTPPEDEDANGEED